MRQEYSLSDRVKDWVVAARPRTLALAVASVGMGSLLAIGAGPVSGVIALLTLLTAVFLQILSNLANDYGDSVHGADHEGRAGPARAVQSGHISARSMRLAIALAALLSAVCGFLTVWLALGVEGLFVAVVFLLIGAAAIWAAISYTAGSLPYGYAGLGDIFVFIFFGWAGVLGSYYLQALQLDWALLLPATSVGLFAVAVLNINNIRDIESDRQAGKKSIPVRLGLLKARKYHWMLLMGGFVVAVVYSVLNFMSIWGFLFAITLPLLLQNGLAVNHRPPAALDPYLRQMSLTTLLFVLTFGLGQLLF